MTRLAIVLLGLASLATAKPSFLSIPLTYVTPLSPGTQVGTNGGGLLDVPEVAAARIAERTGLANGAARSTIDGSHSPRGRPSLARDGAPSILTSYAPLGADGRVVDTPEVAAAKAAHAVAHVNERINLANEIARSGGGGGGALDSSDVADGEPDGRALDAPEVARADGKTDPMANEASRSDDARPRVVNGRVVPLVIGTNGVVAALVPVGPDGGPEVAGDQNLANDVRSVDALAVAGPTLAYGRLVY
ncbi:PREDICTED: cuticle protein 18.7-like [Wasmannia auropunctata]|uniref:cuticle protein 18.7-like n=1 Tax=Wasmannia auropunctata TaxID=64793 RepID=UPI0005EE6A92|nr:PREDICTED: cuticle protein 18.7-like [Wasmannia auropunctata]